MPEGDRRLAAIMFTDIVGYTAMAQEDESGALELLREHRTLVRPIFSKHAGREVKTMGDSFLVEFASALAATECAAEIEGELRKLNAGKKKALNVRIGIHVGDVVSEAGDVYGDAVNIASRIEPLAEDGGTCISQQVYDQVRNKVPFAFSRLEAPDLKNVSIPIEVYRLDLLTERSRGPELRPRATRTLAVLPFANMGPDPGDDYLADGMTEELISTISKIEEIGVISRTSVMGYKKGQKPVREISRELGVGTVLEGSVRKAGNKVRVTVQMIDAIRDRHMWAESYDRGLEDVLEIQSDIAKLVAEALKVKILPHTSVKLESRPTNSSEAYTLYLKGRYHWNKRALEDVTTAIDYFKSAVKEDPNFALGYVGLADCYRVLINNWGVDPPGNNEKAKEMVAKALELDPQLAEAHASRGLEAFSDHDLRMAETEFRKATELKPSYTSAHQWYAQLLIAELRWDEARQHIEKAVELDPFSQIASLVHTFLYEAKRDYAAGLGFAKRGVELSPGNAGMHFELAWFYGRLNMLDEARREVDRGAELAKASFPFAQVTADAIVAYLGEDKRTVEKLLPELEAHVGKTYNAVRFVADLYFFLGQAERGFEWLERSYEQKEFDLFYLKSNESLDGFRTDPRYLDLLRRLGLAGA
ncbi:MAG: hypothetical protein HY296_03265 [Thaumarchaeota archaeon]|nr:hypothetical protein [Nitrososphaerota archaeon]